MKKGNVNGAVKLLTNMSNGVLPFDDETINLSKQKHPKSRELNEEIKRNVLYFQSFSKIRIRE